MSSYAQRTRALMAAALLAVALAFGLAFAMSFTAQAEEGDSQDAPLTAQAAPAAIEYTGGGYMIVKADMVSTFGMLSPVDSFSMTYNSSTDKIQVSYEPSNKTTYSEIYLNANPKEKDTWLDSNKITIESGANLSFTLDPSYAGKAWPIACVKREGGKATETQYYMAIPPLETIKAGKVRPVRAIYELYANNSEKMFKVIKARLTDYAADDNDVLTFYLSGSSYKWAFAGNQDDAVSTFNDRAKNAKWIQMGSSVTFPAEVTYGTYDGGTAKASSGYEYELPVTAPTAKQFSLDVVAFSGESKLGEPGQNFSARNFVIDTSAKTLLASSASDTASVTATSTVEDIQISSTGSIAYTGFTRPFAGGNQEAEKTPLSNDWVGKLSLDLGVGTIYDKAYAVTYEGAPWIADGAATQEPKESDIATIGNDGKLELAIANEYDTNPKTAQLNGNIIKVKMHVADNAPYKEAGTWVDREFKLDFTNRTTATLAISGEALTSTNSVMYRLYNPNSGEHFYTADATERDAVAAAGWNYEGEAWTAPVKSSAPVYRVYSGTDHHYTMDEEEKNWLVNDIGWSDEGIGWYSDEAKGVPLYRVFNPNVDPTATFNNSGSHHYTTNAEERDALVSVGWQDEDIAWYGVK